MPTGAKLGYGSLLKRGNGASPEVFETVAEMHDIPDFGSEAALVEVTNFDSPSSTREYISGLLDGIQFTVTGNARLDSTSQLLVISDHNAKTLRNYQIHLTSPLGIWSFSALTLGWKISVPVAGAQQITFTYKVSGTLTRAGN
jgi:hypothetical protein